MKTNFNLLQTRIVCVVALGIGSFFGLVAATENSADTPSATTAIPWSQLAAKAGADYQGDGLAVIPTAEGARLRCVFQQLEGEATREGLWLTSTVIPPGGTVNDRFRLLAVEGRARHTVRAVGSGWGDRPISQHPTGAQVVLANSGRKIAYSRLKVTDANGRELPARTEVATAPESKIKNQKSEILRVVVNDAATVYPVRIDPTFSDANWSSMGGMAGTDGSISAAVVDGLGNLRRPKTGHL